MPCYRPNYYNNKLKKFLGSKINTESKKNPDIIKIKCGKCIGCQLDYSKNWAIRASHEIKEHKYNYFITLTYNEKNLPWNQKIDIQRQAPKLIKKLSEEPLYYNKLRYKKLNEKYGNNYKLQTYTMSLKEEDIKKFIKKLRNYYYYNYNHKGIKFITNGEYGSKTKRPHYHLILFNLPIKDLKFYKVYNKNKLYTSKLLEKLWDKGYVIIGEANYETANYIARYVLKKFKNIKQHIEYYTNQREPEFIRFSNKPAIGKKWIEQNYQKIYENQNGKIILPIKIKNYMTTAPAYYDKFYKNINENKYNEIKNKRIELMKKRENEINKEININEYNKDLERKKYKQIQILKQRET